MSIRNNISIMYFIISRLNADASTMRFLGPALISRFCHLMRCSRASAAAQQHPGWQRRSRCRN